MSVIVNYNRSIQSNDISPTKVLSQSEILSAASSIIRVYPSFTSAYLFGSYAKGTAHPDSDIDIAVFLPKLDWSKLKDIGGAHMDLEEAFGKKVDLSVLPSGDFLERIKLPIDIGQTTVSTQGIDAEASELEIL